MKFNSRKINTYLLPAICLAGIIVYFLINILQIRFIQDDAFTSFRYVKNFVEGNGLVFNIGERVEGYTNFLWVMILSVPMYISQIFNLDLNIEIVAQTLSIFFCVIVIIEIYILSGMFNVFGRKENSLTSRLISETAKLIPSFLMAVSIPFLYWGISAMETSLFIALTLLSIILYLKNYSSKKPGKSFVIVSVLNTLTRPEGMIFFSLIMLHSFTVNYVKVDGENVIGKIRKSFTKKFVVEIVFYVIAVLVYLGFKLIYYGYPFPNTFYAKTDFSIKFLLRGWLYFWEFAKPFLAYGILLLLPLILWKQKDERLKFSLLYGIILCWILIIIILGGDVLPINRFFLPILPLIFILITKALFLIIDFVSANRRFQKSFIIIIACALLIVWGICNYNEQYEMMMTKRAYESGLVKKMKIYASWICQQVEKDNRKVSVAMSTIGAFSYYSGARVIDLVGLTDEYVAHHPKEEKGINDDLPVLWKERHYNAEYILSKKPDYIIFPAGAKPSAFAECAVFMQPDFVKNYYTNIFYSEELNQLLPIFTRKENIRKFQQGNDAGCDIKFLKHYINANNLFLKMLEENDGSLLERVISQCDSVISFCAERYNDAITIKGYAYYHAKRIDEAERYLAEATKDNPTNMIARYYLKNILLEKGRMNEAIKLMLEIKKYSPDALPYFNMQE
jgi:arabinofuranosyltransferase